MASAMYNISWSHQSENQIEEEWFYVYNAMIRWDIDPVHMCVSVYFPIYV